jgi:hypothetical protein
MSLNQVINEKTIKNRHALLSNYLKTQPIGELTEPEKNDFKHIFSKYYIPDNDVEKFPASSIINVAIKSDKWNKKYFSIYVENEWHPTSIKRLAGSNRTEHQNLIRALRNAIEPQIIDFICNKVSLNPENICPVTNKKLGTDAQVDHEIPFHILAEDWLRLRALKDVTYVYDALQMNYVLTTSEWFNYHLTNAKLRWVSKEGNKYAHKLYLK